MFVDWMPFPRWWAVWSSDDEDGRVLADGFKTKKASEDAMAALAMED